MMRRLSMVARPVVTRSLTRSLTPSLTTLLTNYPTRSLPYSLTRPLTSLTPQVDMPDMTKDQEILDFESDILSRLDRYSLPHSLTGNELISLIQDLPIIVTHMENKNDPIPLDIISRTTTLFQNYQKNFEVFLPSTFESLTTLDTTLPEVRALLVVVAKHIQKLTRSFTDTETWIAINSLRNFDSSYMETLLLVKAIAKKIPVENTKIEFTPVDSVLTSLRGLNELDSDCVEVQELLRAINFRMRHKKGKVKFFSSFQDAVLGVRNKSSDRPEVREFLALLVDVKYRWDAFLPPVLAANEDEEESDEEVREKRNPSRFRLERLKFEDGQEVVDFIRVLGKKPHRYSQFHSLYKKSDSDRESPYLEVISYLDLPVHTPQFIKANSDYITAHHEAGHIVASHLLTHSPAEAVGAKIRRYASYTTFRPKDVSSMDNTVESFMDKHATAMGGLAAEYLILGAISASAGNHDFRSVIDAVKEQVKSDGTFVPKEGSSLHLFLKNVKSLFWVVSGSLDRGGEKDWVDEHVLRVIEDQFFRVLQLLAENENMLRELAELLLSNRSLSEDDIKSIIYAQERESE